MDKNKERGKVADGKVVRSWRIDPGVDNNLHKEATRQRFTSVPAFLNNFFTRYFNGEVLKYDGP